MIKQNDEMFSIHRKEHYSASHSRLVLSGSDYFETLENLIQSAVHTVHLQTYIFDEDETGKRIASALKDAASRGVAVFVMIDGFGSKALSKTFVEDLKQSGVHLRFFSRFPSFQSLNLGRRLHHKVITADENTALIGGINIAVKYHGSPEQAPWLDYAILLKGNACSDIDKICRQIYGKKIRHKKLEHSSAIDVLEKNVFIRIRQNDRFRRKNQISRSYLSAIKNAEHSIYITGSYFLPGPKLRKALVNAGKRGVDVNLILAGVSDVPLFQSATAWLYDLLFRNGIKIFEWNKSVLHGKAALVDDRWATIGSFNLNHLSAYGSIEMNVDVLDENFAKTFKTNLKSVIETGCRQVFPISQNNHLFARLKRWAAYVLTRTSLKLIAAAPYFNPFKKFE